MKKSILLISFALIAGTATARQIDESEARTIAASKVPVLAKNAARVPIKNATSVENNAPVYIFSSPKGGFAIVAGDDRMPNAVLAYSDNGILDLDNCAPSMKAWLDEITAFISAGNFSSVRRSALDYSTPVEPLVTTKWNQSDPYDLLTPLGSTGMHCPTGCAATALAQIMNYWEYPKDGGMGENSYEWNGETLSVDFSKSIYDWDNMADVYDENSTEAQNNAVAKLMWDCGVAINMQYGDDESAAADIDVPKALIDYFGYNPGIRLRYHDYTDDDEWYELVKNELDQKCPILYCGTTVNNEGHAFVCDGYDNSGLYHINWGWGGLCDGYYDLNTLEPQTQGIGGAESGAGFSCLQSILTGLRPAQEGDEAAAGWELTVENFKLIVNSEDNSYFNIYWDINNLGYRTFEGALGMYIVNDDTQEESDIEILYEIYGEDSMESSYGIELGYEEYDVSEMEDGTYTIKFVAVINEEELYPVYYSLKEAPMRFTVNDGKVTYDVRPELTISEVEIDEFGFYYTIGGAVRGLVANMTFNVENTSDIWFTSALGIKMIYTNGVFCDLNNETYHLRDIPNIGPGAIYQLTFPIQYNVKGDVKIEIVTTNRTTEVPQEAKFIDNEFSFESDEVYHELELMDIPKVVEAEGKVTITADVASTTGDVEIVGGPVVDLESITEKEVVCTIYDTESGQVAATTTTTYSGKWNEPQTMVFDFAEPLENGNYNAVLSYRSVADFLGNVLVINLGDEIEDYPGIEFSISTSGIVNIADDAQNGSTEVYTISGIRAFDTDALAPGLYLKRQGNTVSKVIIK